MNRTCSNKRITDTQVRYRARLESEPCIPGTHDSRVAQYNLLRTMLDSPDLLACGPVVFDKMNIFHSGTCWVAESEAIVEEMANGQG